MAFKSPTKGQVTFEEIPEGLLAFYERNKHYGNEFDIVIGTDSQNFNYTKSVTVIAITCKGHGGIFFYEVTRNPLMRDVRSKLYAETQASLECTMRLIDLLENGLDAEGGPEPRRYTEMYENCPISIHVDAGNSERGKTRELVPEIVGWVHSLGYECHVKPESFVASSVADKISK